MSDLEPTEKAKSVGPRQRSRAGCWQCRSKTVKKRCDQERPRCGRCCRLNLECDYAPRPTLAERRKKEKASKLHPPSSPTPETPSHALCVSLAAPTNSACSLDLSPADREAIHHFRFVFPKSHHVNNTDYSLIALMFELASDDPMLMHMVIAISLQEMNARRMAPDHKAIGQSVQHYSDALRLVSNAISPNIGTNDLDSICTALWMMLLYEQQFGDAQYTAFKAHLAGLSSLLQYQFGRTLRFSNSGEKGRESVVMMRRTKAHDPTVLSAYSARLLVWIALMDSAAASAGIGGQVNVTLLKNLLGNENNLSPAPEESINAFASLRRYSAPLYRLAWGREYPQNELLVDMEMADVYILLTECVILRFVVAQLATELCQRPATGFEKVLEVQRAILEVRRKFTRLFDIARELSVETKNTPVTANIRTIIPLFYAVVLDFFRLTSFDKPIGEQQRLALKSIMNLAFQNRQHGGIEAMVKMAWSLFVAALESEDRMEQDWILQQFQELSKFGCNFKRAHDFLLNNIPIQRVTGKRIDVRARMQESALFVLG